MQVRKDIQIFVGNELSCVKKCPTTVVSNNPCIKWILPDDLKGKQTRFCVQIKSCTNHVLSSGKKDRAFYQSGNVESRENFFEINFGTSGLLLQSWRGTIAIRLFISILSKEEVKNLQTPFEYVSDEAFVPGIEWKDDEFNISDVSRYFVFDDTAESLTNINEVICSWKNSFDSNNDKITYLAELSKDPTFRDETFKFQIDDNNKSYTTLKTVLENDNEYFFRVRSFDGLDYSDWSSVHGFRLTSNDKPTAEIISLEDIGNGDIKINFHVFDTKQKKITLRLLYSGGSVKENKAVPTLLEPSHFFIINDENNGFGSFTWKTLVNEQGDADDFILYLTANDGIDESNEFIYGVFSIHNESLFKRKTSAGSYFLNFDVNGIVKAPLKSYGSVDFTVPVKGKNGIIKEYIYYGYNKDNNPFDKWATVYGILYAENSNTFCVKGGKTIYRVIYHHGKYMIYDYDIPQKENEDKKLEKDPYVIAPPYNPTLNVEKEGENISVVYISETKFESILPNGEWFSETKEENGLYYYLQKWGSKFEGDYGFGKFVFEDDQNAPQYTLNPDDLDINGYPKPVSYSQFESIGKDTPIYIKKYRIENGFSGSAKNFKVVNNNGKYERQYFSCRGTPPTIVYENEIPYISYNGILINKYSEENITEEVAELNLPEDSIYIPWSIWNKKIKLQHVAVPYYVLSTEAIYRPGDHKSGIVGKGEPIIVSSNLKQVIKNTHLLKDEYPTNGELRCLRENELVGHSKAKNYGIYLSQEKDVYINTNDGLQLFIYHNDNIESFLERNTDVIIQFNKNNVVIYRQSNFEKLQDNIVKNIDNFEFPYYAYYNKNNECIEYFGLKTTLEEYNKSFNDKDCLDLYARKTVEINAVEKLYYGFVNNETYLIPQDFGMSLNGYGIKQQRYLPKVRKKGKKEEQFDFLDYVCKGNFLEEQTMYYSGVNGWLGQDIVDDHNRAIKFICNIKLPDKLQELKIIYLQYYWDSYNKIHWTGNLGVETYVRIEYTKIENGKETGWKDLKFESSIYNEELGYWLVKPLSYSALIDNFNYKQFEDECQYRMRISGIDLGGKTITSIGPVIATPDFYIDDDAINPFVIESMEFNPWTRQLEIKFRVDDIQGDLYDITGMKYTVDEKTWYDINFGDIIGETSNLKSNTLKNRESGNIIIHTIHWSLSGYLETSSQIRIQMYGTLSKYNVDFDFPHFSWTCWDNQKYKLAEDEENYILGRWIRYEKSYDKNGNVVWKDIIPYRQSGGQLEITINALNDIRKKYEESEKNTSYDEWLQSNYEGGITYASRVQVLQSTQQELQKRLEQARRLRFEAELFTRKELIKQGFYCNGFINNDHENYPPFEWRVLNLPVAGHTSTMDWKESIDKDDTSELNGKFENLTEVVENIEFLKESGFNIKLPLPLGYYFDDNSSPATIEIYSKNDKNYLHINNSKFQESHNADGEFLEANIEVKTTESFSNIENKIVVLSKKETAFFKELNTSYASGKYEISFECFSENTDISNCVKIYLERYSEQSGESNYEQLISSNLISTANITNKQPLKQTFYYIEESDNLLEKLAYNKLVFKCTGDIYLTNIDIKVSEINKEEQNAKSYHTNNIVVKSKIGERHIGKHLADDDQTDEDKYTVYYRFQMDFFKEFNSQRFGVPLRDIIFAKKSSTGELSDIEGEKGRIRGGILREGTLLINKDVTNAEAQIPLNQIEQKLEDSKQIETETSILENEESEKVTFDPNNDKRKYGNLTIPKEDLPGEWRDKNLNESFPKCYDENKFESGTFNGNYYWRVAPYNIVECDYEEISHSLITKVVNFNGDVSVELNAISNENISELKFNGNCWYKSENLKNSHWEFDWIKESEKEFDVESNDEVIDVNLELNRGLVKFPTDAPRNEVGAVISGNNSITHVPNGLERNKPFVLKDNDELNYYMFCSKQSVFNQNVIIQSMGKSWKKFGELSQIYPKYILDKDKEFKSMFSPCAVFVRSKVSEMQKSIYLWSTSQKTDNSIVTTLFVSDTGKVDFESPIICKGLENTYHHSVIYENDCFIMVCCKTHLNKSCLFTFNSTDGINWNELNTILIPDNNVSSPCIDRIENGYKIYLTEWIGQDSRIISYETDDLITLVNKKIELDSFERNSIVYKNPKNPCVIDDVYMGNKVKRLYYNVDISANGKTYISSINTMFLESGKWEKVIDAESYELNSTLFGKENVISFKVYPTIDCKEVRLEIELSDVYKTPKECILQSDWITKDNYETYNAEIVPARDFIYNSIIKEKKYNGE